VVGLVGSRDGRWLKTIQRDDLMAKMRVVIYLCGEDDGKLDDFILRELNVVGQAYGPCW
jgi:hypothetical protein